MAVGVAVVGAAFGVGVSTAVGANVGVGDGAGFGVGAGVGRTVHVPPTHKGVSPGQNEEPTHQK
eukprot:4825887-Prymnesium_polylepis.1